MREGWEVRTVFSTWYRNYDDPLVATGEHEAVQPQILTKQGNAGLTVYLRLYMPVTGKTMAILFCCSPERNGSTHIFKLVARNDSDGSEEMIAKTVVDEDLILVEDLRVLEAYTEMVLHLDLRAEVHTKADRLSVAWRRLMADMVGLAGEQAATELPEVGVADPAVAAPEPARPARRSEPDGGRRSRPRGPRRNRRGRARTGAASRRPWDAARRGPGARSAPWSRARGAPRQRWTPLPNARWRRSPAVDAGGLEALGVGEDPLVAVGGADGEQQRRARRRASSPDSSTGATRRRITNGTGLSQRSVSSTMLGAHRVGSATSARPRARGSAAATATALASRSAVVSRPAVHSSTACCRASSSSRVGVGGQRGEEVGRGWASRSARIGWR